MVWDPSDWLQDVSEGRLVRNVPIEIVDAFLVMFKNHPRIAADADGPREKTHIEPHSGNWRRGTYCSRASRRGHLVLWFMQLPGLRVICQRRKPGRGSNESAPSVSRGNEGWRAVAWSGLASPIPGANRRRREWRAKQQSDGRAGKDTRNYPDRIYRKVRERPLLIIHLLAIGKQG